MPQEKIRAARCVVKRSLITNPVFAPHHRRCRLFVSANCPIGIPCPHGFDVCPKCDPCTCDREHAADVRHAIVVHFHTN